VSLNPATYSEALERAHRYSEKRKERVKARFAISSDSEAISRVDPPSGYPTTFSGVKVSRLQRRKQDSGNSKAVKPLKRLGRKGKAWATERAKLKRRFAAVGIVTCELRYAGCAFDDYLGFAHAKKRRKLTIEDLAVVVLACNFCHDEIEADPRMEEIVLAVITARKVQP
jgi:hypothetical protein